MHGHGGISTPNGSLNWGRIFVIVGIVTLGFLILYPCGMLLYSSFNSQNLNAPNSTLTLQNYVTVYGSPETYTTIGTTFLYAFLIASIVVLVSYAFAWLVVNTDTPLRSLLKYSAVLGTGIPVVIMAIGWTFLLNVNNGAINVVLGMIFGKNAPVINIYSVWGMVFVDSINDIPLGFLIFYAALRSVSRDLEEAAMVHGANTRSVFFRITSGILRPSILGTFTLMFVLALESFGVPIVIGLPAHVEVLSISIYRAALVNFPSQYQLASTYSIALLLPSIIGAYIYRHLTKNAERYVTISGKGFRQSLISLGRWKYLGSAAILIYFLIAIALPIIILIYASLVPYYHFPDAQTLGTLSLNAYKTVLSSTYGIESIQNSLFLAVVGGFIGMLIATLIGYIVVKTRIPGRGVLDTLAFIPWGFPGIVFAVGMIWGFIKTPLYATIWIIMLAYIVRYLLFGVRTASTSLMQVDKQLEEAAYTSGAGVVVTLRRIIAPLVKNGFMSGWLLMILFFIRELSMTIMLYSSNTYTMTVLLLSIWQEAVFAPVAALGVILTAISFALTFILLKMGGSLERGL